MNLTLWIIGAMAVMVLAACLYYLLERITGGEE